VQRGSFAGPPYIATIVKTSLSEGGTPTDRPSITASELVRLLDRIDASPEFCRAPRLRRFPRYATEHAVDRPGRPLKEIEVPMAVFDRDASFDPRLDPIARVEAGRLRRRLSEYYAETKDEEAILIGRRELP
jgi:adenylate cyclase